VFTTKYYDGCPCKFFHTSPHTPNAKYYGGCPCKNLQNWLPDVFVSLAGWGDVPLSGATHIAALHLLLSSQNDSDQVDLGYPMTTET